MTTLTKIERQALEGIVNSEYMDGLQGTDVIDHAIWAWSGNPFKSKRTFSGAVSSLSQKGFVECHGDGEEATIEITKAGWEAYSQPQVTDEMLAAFSGPLKAVRG